MKKKKAEPKPEYHPIPEGFVFPDDLDTGVNKSMLQLREKYSDEINFQGITIKRDETMPDGIIRFQHQSPEKWAPDPDRMLLDIKKEEAEWITRVRNYCREKNIAPTTLITAYEELLQYEQSKKA